MTPTQLAQVYGFLAVAVPVAIGLFGAYVCRRIWRG